ncbi:diguanylate cyclase (GGDEF)-like protein [Kineococcus radiotolerans]|uniref:Diguanylate cyclase (GGDEF)-like protein n=1 Tax=Kineococcus radiotolerans TaxID=131568 RepID=A0A7W4TI90_KINRA|nr:EAL domain-containing protein [Kineococcus radiotolerans]MBB2899376.1 diguanylate cyclase (GGDEF)-like protein [Kineococcus radiotolerans]
MTITDAVRLSAVPTGEGTTLWDLAEPAWVLDATTACADLDRRLRSAPAHRCSSVVVLDHRGGRVGSIQRQRFEHALGGPFGFGRALLARRSLAEVTDFDARVLPAEAGVGEGLAVVFERPAHRRTDDLVLRREATDPAGADAGRTGDGTRWRVLPVAVLMEAAAGRMAWHASRDPLTGLFNRGAFFAQLQRMIDTVPGDLESRGPGTGPAQVRVGVVFVDLDRLKTVNDTLGHDAGDALIRSVAARLRTAARPRDVVARLGGDEFAVACLVHARDEQEATRTLHAIATRHLHAVRTPDARLDPSARSSASVGAALSVPLPQPVGADTLLREADTAMYAAKQAGGDRVSTTGTVGDDGGTTAERVAPSLQRALDRDELVLHYQPIVDARTRHVLSVEALVRWQHPDRGLLGAAEVLDRAHAERLEVALDRWVLRTALAQLRTWETTRHADGNRAPSLINVNVSPASLSRPDLAESVLGAVHDGAARPEQLRLELPETASLSTMEVAGPQLRRLAAAGVALVFDDMGAGASSLRNLSTIPVAGMKIDRSFVAGMLTRQGDRAVVEMLTNLAVGLGLRVTAEGVEDAAQEQELRRLGVTALQGYHIAHPRAADDLPWAADR